MNLCDFEVSALTKATARFDELRPSVQAGARATRLCHFGRRRGGTEFRWNLLPGRFLRIFGGRASDPGDATHVRRTTHTHARARAEIVDKLLNYSTALAMRHVTGTDYDEIAGKRDQRVLIQAIIPVYLALSAVELARCR